MRSAAVLVPIRSFDAGKSRLSPVLDPGRRSVLARTMAEQVVAAARGLATYVATDDERVARWAMARGAQLVWTEALELNESVGSGLDAMRAKGHDPLVVAHADLPFADDLASLTWFGGATLVPDRRDDGTNVLCVPAALELTPDYGPGSFARHLGQLRARGAAVRIARRASLQWDVDVPDDLPAGVATPAVPV